MMGFGLMMGSPQLARSAIHIHIHPDGEIKTKSNYVVRPTWADRSLRLVGYGGFDFVFVDWEHTPMSMSTLMSPAYSNNQLMFFACCV